MKIAAAFAVFASFVLAIGLTKAAPRDTSSLSSADKKPCYSRATRDAAVRSARVYRAPDPGYDPVLGYDPAAGPRKGAPAVDENGRAKPIQCVAAEKPQRITGTLPKFYCTSPGVLDNDGNPVRYKIKPHFKGQSPDKRNGEVYGEFLSSRFSKALGFFADDEWVADVTCPDCEKSLSKGFQGVPFSAFQPAAGVELSLGDGLDADCSGDDSAALGDTLSRLASNGHSKAEIDAFKLWLAFIDHGDTKTDNQRFACLKHTTGPDGVKRCDPGEAVFYIGDMGSTFGYSTASEKKARLSQWKGKDPIKMDDGRCQSTAKGIGDANVSEAGRQLLASGLQHLLDEEKTSGLITKVFAASRNDERDSPANTWTQEFVRKANTIINARCGR